MQWPSGGGWCRLLTVGLLVLVAAPAARAAAKTEVKFYTFDRVELHGTFYAPEGGPRSPAVILVHRLGGSRQDAGWEELATALRKADFAVLSFDLRGHGESTTVEPTAFWRLPTNYTQIRGANPKKEQIAFKDFRTEYYPWLAHDLDAAKQFLDQQNNARLCNSSNLIVIGAQDGGAVAALWICWEWFHRRTEHDAFGRVFPVGPPEGQDISAAVWLSVPATLGRGSLSAWFRAPVSAGQRATVGEKVAMQFLYGKEDTRAAQAARVLMDACKGSRGHPSLASLLAKPGKAAGADLLGKEELKTEQDILNFLNAVLEKPHNLWAQRSIGVLTQIPLSQFGYWLR